MDDLDSQLYDVDITKLFFTDLNGKLMNLSVNKQALKNIVENGVGFDGSSIAGYASVEHSDRLLFPDLESFKKVTFSNKTVGFLVGNVHNEEGAPASTDPRHLLQRVIAEAEEEFGYRFFVGPEYEFFLLNGDEFDLSSNNEFSDAVHSDNAGYFHSTPHDKGELIRHEITKILADCGIQYEKSHHEVTPSQHEINLEYTDTLSAADRSLLFTYITQKVAEENGFYASFMPKPFEDYNRNAFHMHLSLFDKDGNNLFYDQKMEKNLSSTAKNFIGGILKYARETSIIMASTVNSYKAYVIEKEAPIVRGWGFRNRSSMVRVPYALSSEATRIELRSPDPSGNVYLQMAVLISMGLQGIREKLECNSPDKGSTYERNYDVRVWDERFLPRCFYEALVEAEKSTFMKEVLGDSLYNNFMQLKIQEWEDDRVHIPKREHQRYLNV
ncbi:MAG: glutamine synthetase [Deltaproteobacteria bacterium]|nr:glutamine synthetase [Deltaproteobacteria bacterium]